MTLKSTPHDNLIKKPSYHSYEEYENRLTKLNDIKEMGMDPYPAFYKKETSIGDIALQYVTPEYNSEDAENGDSDLVNVAGRLVLFRAMGKNAFGHVQDESGRLQIMCNRDLTKVEGLPGDSEIKPLKFIEKKIDLGDIVGVEGHIFHTHKGELTLFVKKLTLLCKTLLPLPDKHAGLVDKGTRYRKRWLDLICRPDVMETFRLRSNVIKTVREVLTDHTFMEVENPCLQNIYGGAEAEPFKTHLNALDQEMFLRISLEIPLKKLIIGGMERVFEIGKVFRNEGIDRTHNPEFTMLEAYAAYWDYEDVMEFVENLFETIALKLFGKTSIDVHHEKTDRTVSIELKAPWKRISMKESIKEYADIDFDALGDEEIKDLLVEKTDMTTDDLQSTSRGKLMAYLFEEFVEEKLIQPHHIIDHPIETTPLCKLHRDPHLKSEGIIERFESFIMGFEFCNAYSELNDPVLQRSLLEEQAIKKLNGDKEASPLDEEFLEAICQGMPPTGGFGIGIDRLVMLFASVHSIRDVLLFPLMRSEEGTS